MIETEEKMMYVLKTIEAAQIQNPSMKLKFSMGEIVD